MSHALFRTALLAVLVLAAGCQHRTITEPATVQLPVPFFPQERYQCGPAALASMLAYADREASPDALVEEVWLPGRNGSLVMELAAAARARGLLVYPVSDMNALRRELDAGHPVLVQANLLFDWWPKWHFAVVTGYGPSHFLLHSGEQRAMTVSERWLENHWGKADHTGYVMLAPHVLPASARPDPLLGAITDLEHSLGGAQTGWWQGAVARFPEHAMLHFAHGNALFADGDTDAAAQAFRRALKRDATLAPAWNNLAWVLWRGGAQQAAVEAVERALVLSPGNPAFQDTREQILSGEQPGDT